MMEHCKVFLRYLIIKIINSDKEHIIVQYPYGTEMRNLFGNVWKYVSDNLFIM